MTTIFGASLRATINATALLGAAILIGCSAGPAQRAAAQSLEPLLPPGSPFHGVHGLRFDGQGELYATSVIGQSIFKVNVDTGEIERVIGPPEGMGDDIAIAPDGTLFWTAIEDGIVYTRAPGGPIRRLVEDMKGVNAISFSPDFERLFFTLVFYGDALYELDPTGATPPRLISENHGGLNAFEVADDGMIYGPLVFGGRVVRIDPDTGEIATVSDEFESPGALKLAGDGSAFVLDETHLKRVVLSSGLTTTVAELPSGGDNLAVSELGLVYVSLAAENAIIEVEPNSGAFGYVTGPSPLDSPAGLAISADGQTLYVGDMFGGFRAIDTATAAVTDTAIDIFQPTHVSASDEHLIVVGEVFGEIQRLDRRTFEVLDRWEGFALPHDALETPNGDLIVAEAGSGRILRVTGPEASDRVSVVEGLDEPTGLAWADADAVYVSETGGGRLLRVELASGAASEIASNLDQPEGIAIDADDNVLVVEVGARRLRSIAPDGMLRTIAENLPVGLTNGPSLYRGIAVGANAIYLSSDIDNTIYRLSRD
jgi:sugar lactone lactonase YvrE